MTVRSDLVRVRGISPGQVYGSDRMLFWKRSTRWLLYLQPAAEASGPAARMSHKEVTQ